MNTMLNPIEADEGHVPELSSTRLDLTNSYVDGNLPVGLEAVKPELPSKRVTDVTSLVELTDETSLERAGQSKLRLQGRLNFTYLPTLPDRKEQSEIKAVIQEVGDATIALVCLFDDRRVRIKLPPALVPETLRRFGAPVTVRLSNVSGYRKPVVEERFIPREEPTEEDRAMDSWIDGLVP